MALIVLDASVVIAHLETLDAHHEAATAAVAAYHDADLRLPASAYAESLVLATRAGRLDRARLAIRSLGLAIVPIDDRVAEVTASVRARIPTLRLPDALVLGCGEALDADVVLTADRRWHGYPRVQVVGVDP
ncbi:MAG TPA: type II toxin-antitoxin system VapC family toxin [Gaiellaceae bacterium]|nr:type II toxin-antitoxin system VapC family toxin [Gaiellaceae bacterium]